MEKLFSIGYLRNYNSKEVCFHNKTPLRKTTSYEIELYTLGGNITVINGKEYLQKPGNVVVASPGDARYSIKYFKCYSIHFSCYCTEIIDYLNSLPKVFEFYNQKKLFLHKYLTVHIVQFFLNHFEPKPFVYLFTEHDV